MTRCRLAVQACFILLMAYIGYRHQLVGPLGQPPIDAYCPFGALETLPTYLTNGFFLSKTAPSNFWLLVALIVTTLFSGAIFCGWICPLGGLSDWLYKIRRSILTKKIDVPPNIANILSYARYLMLFGIVYFSWILGRLWFEKYDPFKAIFHMKVQGITSIVVIGTFVIASLMIERAWCRFLCPLGLFVGTLAKLSLLRIERNTNICVNCKACDRVCPTAVKVSESSRISNTYCIHCFECLKSCHTNALEFKSVKGGFIVFKPVAIALIALSIFVGTLGVARVSGGWDAKNPSAKVALELNHPSEIKGWMRWTDVVTAFHVDENKLIKELQLPDSFDRNMSLKALDEEFGFKMGTFRRAIEKYRKR